MVWFVTAQLMVNSYQLSYLFYYMSFEAHDQIWNRYLNQRPSNHIKRRDKHIYLIFLPDGDSKTNFVPLFLCPWWASLAYVFLIICSMYSPWSGVSAHIFGLTCSMSVITMYTTTSQIYLQKLYVVGAELLILAWRECPRHSK